MGDFLLDLARIWRGNYWNKAGFVLIAGGVAGLTGIWQYLIVPIGLLFGLQIAIPEALSTWVSIFLILVGFLMFVLNRVLPDRSMQSTMSSSSIPGVRAIINRDRYPGGWRSVQLHITPPPGQEHTYHFSKHGWRIDSAKLLSPRGAVLARAKDDDYTSRVFYPEGPTRCLDGRPVGHVQPFALEFFIKFDGPVDSGRKAKFQVKLNHTEDPKLRHTIQTWSEVPSDAN
jgi:hypothetical protein